MGKEAAAKQTLPYSETNCENRRNEKRSQWSHHDIRSPQRQMGKKKEPHSFSLRMQNQEDKKI